MTMEELDTIRGYGITLVVLAFVAIGFFSNFIPAKAKKLKAYAIGATGFFGGIGGLVIFFLFNFISGWDEYFAAKSTGNSVEYTGRHQVAAKVIKTLGEMEVSSVGIVFGVLGIY